MRKSFLFLFPLFYIFFLFSLHSYSQNLKLQISDLSSFVPLKTAYVYNYNQTIYAFSNAEGLVTIKANINDTLIITKSTYKQEFLIVNSQHLNSETPIEILMVQKAILLSEVKVIALNKTYEGFKKDVVTMKDPYMKIDGIEMTQQDRINAEYLNKGPNVFRNTAFASPITYLYSMFNKKEKRKRLANELFENQSEVDKIPQKYNRKIVSEITGLEGESLLEFMTYCRFSYYDIALWTEDQIITAIKEKYYSYIFNTK